MNKELEEISDIISNCIEFDDIGGGSVSIDEDEVAKAIHNAGYRKQMWRKVVDGDLPEYRKYVVGISAKDNAPTTCRLTRVDNLNFHGDMWEMDYDEEYYHQLDEIIAWTELPEYSDHHKDVDEDLHTMPNLKFNIGDVISNIEDGRKFVVLDILYSKGAKDYLYHIDDTELCVDFNIRFESAEKFYEKL